MAASHGLFNSARAWIRGAVGALLRSPLAASILASVLVFLGILGLRASGTLEALELAAYDWYLRVRPSTAKVDSRIVLLTMTENDIRQQGRWPLPDATLAQILEILTQYQPRVIGLDLYRDVPVPPGYEDFAAILTSNPRIVAVMKFGTSEDTRVPPPPVLQQTEQVGFTDVVVDPGGIVRRGLLFLDDGNTTVASLALRLALPYLRAEGIEPHPDPVNPAYLRLGKMTIRPFEPNDGGYVNADASGYQFLLDFRTRRAFPTFSLSALLSGEVDPAAIRDKVVLIGAMAVSVKDAFFTPYSRGLDADQQLPGITLHAYSVSQLLRCGLDGHAMITTMSDQQEALWILLWSLLGAVLGYWIHGPWRFVLAGASGPLVLGLVGYEALMRGWWIPVIPPVLAWGFSAALVTAYMSYQERVQRTLLMHLFAQHVSPEVAETIWQQRQDILAGGRVRPQRLTASVFFSDLEGFTSVSEQLTPEALLDWLNTYMEVMAEQVRVHGGVINKYIGDSIMAFFGVPVARRNAAEVSQDARQAVQCALAMERALRQLNQRWHAQGQPTIGMRIGIYTGPLVAGEMGSARRLEYTVLGDTVNTASRLESFDKEVFAPHTTGSPCRILIGEATFHSIGKTFQTHKVGEVHLKGKEATITIYRVLGRQDDHRSGHSREEHA
jgi:adenylate cyclase